MRICFLILILLAGCSADPVDTFQSDNKEIRYEYLFTIKEEGVRIYRFTDGGNHRYVAVKTSAGVIFGDRHSTGKSSYMVPQNIETVQ
jgi:hypothetical protein